MAVIETFTFRLSPGAGESAFLDADQRVQTEFTYRQPGVVRRTAARAEDGEWLVVVVWRSGSDADAAAARFGDDPETSAFREMVDASTVRTRRYTTLD
jgi:hypothetical protein